MCMSFFKTCFYKIHSIQFHQILKSIKIGFKHHFKNIYEPGEAFAEVYGHTALWHNLSIYGPCCCYDLHWNLHLCWHICWHHGTIILNVLSRHIETVRLHWNLKFWLRETINVSLSFLNHIGLAVPEKMSNNSFHSSRNQWSWKSSRFAPNLIHIRCDVYVVLPKMFLQNPLDTIPSNVKIHQNRFQKSLSKYFWTGWSICRGVWIHCVVIQFVNLWIMLLLRFALEFALMLAYMLAPWNYHFECAL